MKYLKRIFAFAFVTCFLAAHILSFEKPKKVEAAASLFQLVKGYTQSSIYYAYSENLTSTQKEICDYLVGLYNSIYLGARGFNFNQQTIDEPTWKDKLKQFGQRVMTYTGGQFWQSRIDDVFAQYLSSCIQYAMNQNYNTFELWYADLPADFSVPYAADLLDSWTNFYNDPSNDGIATFGDYQTNWVSGIFYDYAFANYPWVDSSAQNTYNNFILSHNPVVFSNDYANGSFRSQAILALSVDLPDSIFILRGSNNSAQYFRYGYSNITVMPSNIMYALDLTYRPDRNIVFIAGNGYTNNSMSGIINTGSVRTYMDFIDYVFYNYNPIAANSSGFLEYFYPYISHVYLVDNLNTLSNVEEIYNTTTFGITGNSHFIDKPDTTVYLYPKDINWPVQNDIKRIIIDNSKTEEGDQVTENNYYQTIIQQGENTLTDLPSIDVNWFSTGEVYIEYLWDLTKPFLEYVHDVLDCLTFTEEDGFFSDALSGPGIAVLAVVVCGLAGGILSKLLL